MAISFICFHNYIFSSTIRLPQQHIYCGALSDGEADAAELLPINIVEVIINEKASGWSHG